MSQFRINPAVVREELIKIINENDWWDFKGNDAERLLTYTAGALDMANAIIKRYEGGNNET